jgi:hypothetical protein
MVSTMKPRILYIMSVSHSGSTLLDLLVSGHSQALSVGEAKRFSPTNSLKMSCTCQVELVWDCPFWGQVDSTLQRSSSLTLKTLDLCGGDDQVFVHHNRAFYTAVAQVTGRNVIVDSSKNFKRLRRLLSAGEFDLLPIHLRRQPPAVVYSHVKKGRHWLRCSLDYRKQDRRTRALLKGVDHAVVRYEELATRPEGVLKDLMPRFGLDFESQQLDWAGRERHNCGGNRMRHSSSSAIRVDREWQTGLKSWQKTAVGLLTYSARS